MTTLTFDKAVAQAKEKDGELTTAGLLRAIREIITPNGVPTELDINVVAAELTRDIESQSRKAKLQTVVRLRSQLNPTIRKKLILALKNAKSDLGHFEGELLNDFREFPANGKCHQRMVREMMAEQPDPLLADKKALAADFKNATVREISLAEARNVIVAHEWLGSLGSPEYAFGLFFGNHIAGVVCFGSTAGTMVRLCRSDRTRQQSHNAHERLLPPLGASAQRFVPSERSVSRNDEEGISPHSCFC